MRVDRERGRSVPRFIQITPQDRSRIEALVESLIDMLDLIDGDPDCEPSLGWSRTGATSPFDGYPRLVDLEEGRL